MLKVAVSTRSTVTANQILKRVAMKNSIHYSKQNTAIAMSVKFAALVSLGQQTSHSLQSLCFAPCNVIYYLALLYPNVIDIFLLGFIWLGCTMRAALRYGGKSG